VICGPGVLVLLRHGQSISNAAREFTGWLDSPLTALGRRQSVQAGRRLAAAGVYPDAVHTSLLSRAMVSADLALAQAGRYPVPVRRSWRLNERHYGALTGRNKEAVRAEVGEQRYRQWRNSLQVAPPPMGEDALQQLRRDPRYAALAGEQVPASESLGEVLARLLPYWTDVLVPELAAGWTVLVVAHGNSLRALVCHLDHLSQTELTATRTGPGAPLKYQFNDSLRPVRRGGVLLPAAPTTT